jgi:hypothetical protein
MTRFGLALTVLTIFGSSLPVSVLKWLILHIGCVRATHPIVAWRWCSSAADFGRRRAACGIDLGSAPALGRSRRRPRR